MVRHSCSGLARKQNEKDSGRSMSYRRRRESCLDQMDRTAIIPEKRGKRYARSFVVVIVKGGCRICVVAHIL